MNFYADFYVTNVRCQMCDIAVKGGWGTDMTDVNMTQMLPDLWSAQNFKTIILLICMTQNAELITLSTSGPDSVLRLL